MRMLADHAALRPQVEDLKESLGDGFFPDQLIELGRLLHNHVRLEEDRIFPRIEKALTEIELKIGWIAAHTPTSEVMKSKGGG